MRLSGKFITSLEGSILILISALMFGSYGVFSKYLSGYDVFFQTYVRCGIVALIFAMYGLWRKQFRLIEKKDIRWFLIILSFTTFSIAPIVYAFQHMSLGLSSFLFYASFTIFSYLFGFLFFHEKMTVIKMISFLLSFAGMSFIFAVNFSSVPLLPILLAVLNGVASAGEVTFSKKISSNYSAIQINFSLFGWIALTHMLFSITIGERQDWSFLTTALPVLLPFILVAIIGMMTVIRGYKLVEPSIGAIIGLMEIVFGVVLGWILFSEHLGMTTILGGLLILSSALLPNAFDFLKQYTGQSKK